MRHAPDEHPACSATPLTDAELIGLGNAMLSGGGLLLLGVSGGPDSMALMLMAARWRDSVGPSAPPIHVATVDHGLRAGSDEEARWVARQAASMGFKHHTPAWRGAKPTSGRQQAARVARYELLAELAVQQSHAEPDRFPVSIVLAHHLDDQAETLIMRLQRGSGLDGLAGMKTVRRHTRSSDVAERRLDEEPEIRIVRPLLAMPKARLIATLQARGIPWLQDPSNASPDFERVRVRQTMKLLGDIGLTRKAIGISAQRLARAGAALEQLTEALADRSLATNQGAYARIATADFDVVPTELRLRLIQRLVRWYGGASEPPRLTKLEALVDRLARGQPMAATLAGCQIRRTGADVLALREPGRIGLPELLLLPGETASWDRRFVVGVGPGRAGPVVVKALPPATLTRLNNEARRHKAAAIDLPRAAALSLPSFWDSDSLLAIAHPAFGVYGLALADPGRMCDNLSARFVTP